MIIGLRQYLSTTLYIIHIIKIVTYPTKNMFTYFLQQKNHIQVKHLLCKKHYRYMVKLTSCQSWIAFP